MSKIPFRNINIGVNASEQSQGDYDDYGDYDDNYDNDECEDEEDYLHNNKNRFTSSGDPRPTLGLKESIKRIKKEERKEKIGVVFKIIIFFISFLIFSKIFEFLK